MVFVWILEWFNNINIFMEDSKKSYSKISKEVREVIIYKILKEKKTPLEVFWNFITGCLRTLNIGIDL